MPLVLQPRPRYGEEINGKRGKASCSNSAGSAPSILNAIDLRRRYKGRDPMERKRVFQTCRYISRPSVHCNVALNTQARARQREQK